MERGNNKLVNALFNFEIGLESFHCIEKMGQCPVWLQDHPPLSLWYNHIGYNYILLYELGLHINQLIRNLGGL